MKEKTNFEKTYLSLRWWFLWRQRWLASWTCSQGGGQPCRWPCGKRWLICKESSRGGTCFLNRLVARILINLRYWWRSEINAPLSWHCSSLIIIGTWQFLLPNRLAWSKHRKFGWENLCVIDRGLNERKLIGKWGAYIVLLNDLASCLEHLRPFLYSLI